MTRLLVTGASGLLGLNLCMEAAVRCEVVGQVNSHPLVGAPFATLQTDLGTPGAFARLLDAVRPDWVVHCAALANVDACEQNPAFSARLNAELPGEVAEACGKAGARLVHISTDAVFDGLRGDYSEDDAPNPQGVYARDKLAGEGAVLAANPAAAIARVNMYGWSLQGKRSLAEFFFNNLSESKRVNGFTDVVFCPLLVNTLGELLLEMLEKGLSGLYHALSSQSLSKYAFGLAMARRFGLDESLITPISVSESGLLARRSPNLTMRVGKLEAALGHAMPAQAEGLERLYELWAQGYVKMLRSFQPSALSQEKKVGSRGPNDRSSSL